MASDANATLELFSHKPVVVRTTPSGVVRPTKRSRGRCGSAHRTIFPAPIKRRSGERSERARREARRRRREPGWRATQVPPPSPTRFFHANRYGKTPQTRTAKRRARKRFRRTGETGERRRASLRDAAGGPTSPRPRGALFWRIAKIRLADSADDVPCGVGATAPRSWD
jgi:hypothetical protein